MMECNAKYKNSKHVWVRLKNRQYIGVFNADMGTNYVLIVLFLVTINIPSYLCLTPWWSLKHANARIINVN